VTEIKLKGDKVIEQIPSIKDKALRINLNENIYGTFAEIGAGQETVRHFFRAVVLQEQLQKQCQPTIKILAMLFMVMKKTEGMSLKAA
jgi:hypothetical protein